MHDEGRINPTLGLTTKKLRELKIYSLTLTPEPEPELALTWPDARSNTCLNPNQTPV
jgi:hypothetical protein